MSTQQMALLRRRSERLAFEQAHDNQPWHDGTFTSWSAERSDQHWCHVTWAMPPTTQQTRTADSDAQEADKRWPTERTYTPFDTPVGTRISLGHPGNEAYAFRTATGWRAETDGRALTEEDFYAGWLILSLPAYTSVGASQQWHEARWDGCRN